MLTPLSTLAIAISSNMSVTIIAEHYNGRIHYGNGTLAEQQLGAHMGRWANEATVDMQSEATAIARASVDLEESTTGPTEHEITHELKFRSDDFVSVLRMDYAYLGGASGSIWQVPLNWDRNRGTLISIEEIFGTDDQTYKDLAVLLRKAVIQDVWGGNADGWEAAIDGALQPSPDYMTQFTFASSTQPGKIGGLTWHFDPGTVAPGSKGTQSVTISQKTLRALVETAYLDEFRGQPVADLMSRDDNASWATQ